MGWGSSDNYSYLLTDEKTTDSWLFDPSIPKDVDPVLPKDVNIKAIVNTHHHYDHSGGNDHYLKKFPSAQVIAGRDSPLVSYTPKDNESLTLGANIEIRAIHTPCHTQDSICYYVKDRTTNEEAVFTGDTLFNAGCGRFFEGDAQQMDVALNEKLASLPASTKVFPGHEYTASNVKFAKSVFHNEALSKLDAFTTSNETTTGEFTIGDELKHNPFMRLTDPEIQQSTGFKDRLEVLQKLRDMKNSF